MRKIIQDMYLRFAGSDVFILGGGNSLKNFNFSILKNKNVIAINSSYKFVGENAVLYWGDASWGAKYAEPDLLSHPSKFKFSSRANINLDTVKTGLIGEHFLKKTGDFGFDPDINHVRGNNSGTQALNFAVNLNAKRILLLGFDMGYTFGKSHFHHEHETAPSTTVYTDMFIPSITSMSNIIKDRVEVINCSDQSSLKCFKFGNYGDYI